MSINSQPILEMFNKKWELFEMMRKEREKIV